MPFFYLIYISPNTPNYSQNVLSLLWCLWWCCSPQLRIKKTKYHILNLTIYIIFVRNNKGISMKYKHCCYGFHEKLLLQANTYEYVLFELNENFITHTIFRNIFYHLVISVYSHRLTLGRAKECQMILRFVTKSRPEKSRHFVTFHDPNHTSYALMLQVNGKITAISVISFRVFNWVQAIDQHLSWTGFHLSVDREDCHTGWFLVCNRLVLKRWYRAKTWEK